MERRGGLWEKDWREVVDLRGEGERCGVNEETKRGMVKCIVEQLRFTKLERLTKGHALNVRA